MAFKLFSDVREVSVTTGTGDKQLSGAVSGYKAFSSRFADGDTTWCGFKMTPDFEIGLYRYNSGANSLTPLTVYESTNADAAVIWGAGTKDVFCCQPGWDNIPHDHLAALNIKTPVNHGRLAPATGVFEPAAAVTGATSLFWTTGNLGNLISLYDGTSVWSTFASAEKSVKATDAQSGATHNGTAVIDGLTDTSQLVVGMKISGTNVGAAATILSVDSATQVTASVNSTGSATNTITFKLPANTGYDVYGKNVANALKLFLTARSPLFTATANTTQDGIAVKSGDTTKRWLGWFKTSNTDGQIDYTLSGKYRFSIFNQDNRIGLTHVEFFAASSTYDRSPAMQSLNAFALGGTGAVGAGASISGGSSSFGAHVTGTGGTAGDTAATSNNVLYSPQRSSSGTKFAASINATETVTVSGSNGYVEVLENLAI